MARLGEELFFAATIDTTFTFKFHFLQRIESGLQYTNLQSDSIKMTGFIERHVI